MTELSHAVFLSYASQDAEAARRICEALRAAGIEVFLDQSELRGGDAWDQKIRHEIHDCALFIPIVSQHTQERLEGYFRHEWKLAIERIHHMAEQKPFLVPVVVDGIRDKEAFVPEAFRAVQWTHLPGGDTPPSFVIRIKHLLSPELSPLSAVSDAAPALREPVRATTRSKPLLLAIFAVFAALACVVADKFWVSNHLPAPAAFAPPQHSIAVLPFVDMSEKHDQEYFSDGLSEELIDLLTKIPDLRVPARTSSFFFKGKSEDISTIAQRLHVTHVLEGSVRKAANTIRVTAQLIRADNGYHVWSETYERPLKDIFSIQDDIAEAVVKALRVSLLGARSSRSVTTANPEAYSLYLQGRLIEQRLAAGEYESAVAYLRKALELDPKFAAAWAELAIAAIRFYATFNNRSVEDFRRESLAAADRAISLDPNLAEAHLAIGMVGMYVDWDWSEAESEFNKALELDPGSAEPLLGLGRVAVVTGRYERGLQLLNSAIVRDPLNYRAYQWLAILQSRRRQYAQAEAAQRTAVELNPTGGSVHQWLGYQLLVQGKSAEALLEFEKPEDPGLRRFGVMLALDALGRTREAEEVEAEEEAKSANEAAANIAAFYACRKDGDRAFSWLDRAYRQRDGYLITFVGDFCFDKLKGDPRYAAFLRKMNLAGGS